MCVCVQWHLADVKEMALCKVPKVWVSACVKMEFHNWVDIESWKNGERIV
jgi:hypothetical protein